jgi:hypothetical protein
LGPEMEYLMKCIPGLAEATVRDWREEVELNRRNDGAKVTSRLLGVRITWPEVKGDDENSKSDDGIPRVIRGYLGVVMYPTWQFIPRYPVLEQSQMYREELSAVQLELCWHRFRSQAVVSKI